MEKAASSKGFTIEPRANVPKSPPFSAEPGSCEYFFANSENFVGFFFTSANTCSAFFLASALASGDDDAETPIKM